MSIASPPSSIKVEILIPLFYNNGSEIEDERFAFIEDELVSRFEGYSQFKTPVEGVWQNQTGRLFRDTHKSLWVICPDTPENIIFFQQFKIQLENLLQQESIFMTVTHNVTIL